jgi:hypothetical protein
MRVCECRRVSKSFRVRVRAGLCVLVRVRARRCGAPIRMCGVDVRACARICVRVHVRARACAWAGVAGCSLYSSAGGAGGRACVVAVGAIGFRCRARSAAGITFSNRTSSAPWGARYGHTSVVDAAGAIYVIGGGSGSTTRLKDVWASTAGGA